MLIIYCHAALDLHNETGRCYTKSSFLKAKNGESKRKHSEPIGHAATMCIICLSFGNIVIIAISMLLISQLQNSISKELLTFTCDRTDIARLLNELSISVEYKKTCIH